MKSVTFHDLYNTEFILSETLAKTQNWYTRNNFYSCIGKPKPSHTFLWFKNCKGKVRNKNGKTILIEKNQIAYMSKGTEYTVEFYDTAPNQADTIVIHFQLTDLNGVDITPSFEPIICIKSVDVSMGMYIEIAADEFQKNIMCIPEITSVIYRIFAHICKKQRTAVVKSKFSYIRAGIELLENNSDKDIDEIAKSCGISEGYFRKLFREYSGENPIDFRQRHRIEKAKQLLMLDTYSIGEIAEELHFSDIYHFSKTFKKYCGVSPSKYIEKVKK